MQLKLPVKYSFLFLSSLLAMCAGGYGLLGCFARGTETGQDHATQAGDRDAQQTSCIRVSRPRGCHLWESLVLTDDLHTNISLIPFDARMLALGWVATRVSCRRGSLKSLFF